MDISLPIFEVLPKIKNYLNSYNLVLLQAAPGAGKSTVVPLELMNEPWLRGKKILVLEPRRLAAKSVASRMAENLQEEIGDRVGYRVRFDTRVSRNTRVEVVTDGILTRMLQEDSMLEDVGLIIFDEFHERSLQGDLALALTREVQQVLRDDLRILIMSATLAVSALKNVLGDCPLVESPGKQYPVEEIYEKPGSNQRIEDHVSEVVHKAFREQVGDILVFLPGVKEIFRVKELLEGKGISGVVIPLYGDLPSNLQENALYPDPDGRRKVILATSIAETSLTIHGVKVVIDSGLSRVPKFDPGSGMTMLETVKLSLDSAEQRKGRAGRLGPGVCYRLWSKGSHQFLVQERTPEILEADLTSLMLELANWTDVSKINELEWITQPPAGNSKQAIELLKELNALAGDKISVEGKRLLSLPTHPRIAHLLSISKNKNMLDLGIDIASLLDERDPFERNKSADLSERIKALRLYRAGNKKEISFARVERLAKSWRNIFKVGTFSDTFYPESVGELLAAAYPDRIARKVEENRYKLSNGRSGLLADADPLLTEEWIVVANMDAGREGGMIYLAAPLDPEAIKELAIEEEVVEWDFRKNELVCEKRKRIGAINLEVKPVAHIPDEQRIDALCRAVQKDGHRLLDFKIVEQLQARVSSMRKWRPEEEWPDMSIGYLCQNAKDWLPLYLSGVKKKEDFAALDLNLILKGILSWDQQQELEKLAPEKFKVPSGSLINIEYKEDGGSPVLSVRLQEMFGLPDTPKVNEGRNQMQLHLLSPGFKPVQVTQDLKSFWENTYPEVKKELKGRYPKHFWPDDPWTAEAVRGVKRRS